MKLKYCSLTGADDEIAVADLSALGTEFPFVEWAILLLPARAGTLRFPKIEWIEKFSAEYKGAHKAMHLCDDGFLKFVANDKSVLKLMSGFQRIQLNLKFGEVEGKYDTAELVARVKENPGIEFILQYTMEKQGLLPLFRDIKNHAVLYDASAGRGISPDRWDAPLDGHFTGYAGGINPDNAASNIEMISKAAKDHVTWIDMETGVRTDNRFDLAKCRRVLEIAKPYAI